MQAAKIDTSSPEKTSHTHVAPKGTVIIDETRCKGCGFCIAFCPTRALAFSDRLNARGYRLPELAHPQNCNGCDNCGMFCPDFAIYGVRLRTPKKASRNDKT
ncbi:MAG: 4Fe-4S binding protein [Myxococcales bacterium]|jgi:2-oxoglutarate ferredoxin oxidoreductase subunit delta|nr:4Fe-4S binding protein [Myxococcales bacterium]